MKTLSEKNKNRANGFISLVLVLLALVLAI
jgi:hypothetical protein